MTKIKNGLYRFINEDGEIIYIGKAINVNNRLNNHSHLPDNCYKEIKNIEYTTFDTEDECLFAERYYVSKLKPKYNTKLKNRDILFRLGELDDKIWSDFSSKDSVIIDEKIDNIDILEEQINNVKNSLSELNTEHEYILNEWRNLPGNIDFDTELWEHLSFLGDSINKLEEELTDLLKKRIKYIIGEEEYLNLTETQLKYFVKYETFNNEDTLNIIFENIELEHLNKIKQEIDKYGFYDYSNSCVAIESSFAYNRTSYDSDWLLLVDDANALKKDIYTDKTRSIAKKAIKSIEERLAEEYGKFNLEVFVQNSITILGALKGVSTEYPNAIIIKRPIKLENKFKKMNLPIIGL